MSNYKNKVLRTTKMENKTGMKRSEGKSSKLELNSLWIKRKDSMRVFTDLLN